MLKKFLIVFLFVLTTFSAYSAGGGGTGGGNDHGGGGGAVASPIAGQIVKFFTNEQVEIVNK